MEQIRARRQEKARDQDQASSETPTSKEQRAEALKKELDDLLDEIDEVLATNAEEFVSSYVQRGGQ